MRRYVPELVRRARNFDLIFSNSLIYLEAGEIPAFLALCSRLCGHFHFYSSTSEDFEPDDPYRVTLRPRAWWRNAFMSNGFAATRSRYLWRATRKPGSRLPSRDSSALLGLGASGRRIARSPRCDSQPRS
jgi:hypothetical protein